MAKYLDSIGLTTFWNKIKATFVSKSEASTTYSPKLVILSYGEANAWNKFITAYQANAIVYCRASSNTNPATGTQGRLAFLAYVNNGDNPTEVEFQYYRSVSTHSDSTLGDEVYVYKLNSTSGWSVTKRNAYSKVVAGTGLSSSYSNGNITLNSTFATDNPDLAAIEALSGTSGLLKKTGANTWTLDSGKADMPLVIDVEEGDTTVPSGTYSAIGDAIAAGREVMIKYTFNSGSVFHFPLVNDGSNDGDEYDFYLNLAETYYYLTIFDDNTLDGNTNYLAYGDHSHGNITVYGTLQADDITIANGDKLVVTDASSVSPSHQIAKTSVTFDGSTTTQALSKKGTWETFAQAPLYIAISSMSATTVPSGTYTSITTALAAGREVYVVVGSNLHLIPFASDEMPGEYYVFSGIDQGTCYNILITDEDKVITTTDVLAYSSHTHGNLTNDGKLQTTDVTIANGDKLVVTDSSNSNKVARTSVSFDGSTTTQALSKKGTWEPFLTAHQDISGKADRPLVIEVDDTDTTVPSGTYAAITAALAAGRDVIIIRTMTNADEEKSYYHLTIDYTLSDYCYHFLHEGNAKHSFLIIDQYDTITEVDYSFAVHDHTHGNIKSSGALQNTDVSIASGDKLVITDSSNSDKIARTSLAFDGSTTTQALSKKGTWENFLKTQVYLGTCSTSANTYIKTATVDTFPLDSNNKPLTGTVVGIKFSNTNTYATSGDTYQLNVNTTGNYPMYYNNAELATSTSANTLVAGYKNRYTFYMFNGTQWVFLFTSYDTNTTYSAMTQAEIDAGTSTTGRTMTPARLRSNFYTEGEVDTLLAGKANIGTVQTVTAAATISPNISSGNIVVVSGSTNIGTVTPTMENGQEMTILFTASTSYDVTFGSSAYVTPDGSDLIISVPTSGYCEASIVKAGGNLYVRAI